MGNLPQICDEGKLKNESPQTKSPEPQAATGGGGDNRASLAKRSVLRWVCCRVGPKEFSQARCVSAVCVCEHRGELDEEKPRFVQCKVELESTVASLRHILISPGVGRQASRSGWEAGRRGRGTEESTAGPRA